MAECDFICHGMARLGPLLEDAGFRSEQGGEGVASGGSFATGFFRRGSLEIGLIVRGSNRFGCPNYSEGNGYAGHDDMMWALGRESDAQLIPGTLLEYVAR